MDDKIGKWIENNSKIFQKRISLILFILGICLIAGEIKDWDWLYTPDKEYHSNWGIGKISRYFGRKTARIIGFAGGIAITAFDGISVYGAFFK